MEKVKIIDISLSKLGFVVLLQSLTEDKTLPIFIGMPEAQAIAVQYNNIKTIRPLTHDLLKNILTLLDCSIDKVIIDDYKEHTYYAKIFFETEKNHYQIDSRPSDAIALALKFDVPIFVEKKIMEEYSIKLVKEEEEKIIEEEDNVEEESKEKTTDEINNNETKEKTTNQYKQKKDKISKEDKKTRINILRKKLNKSIEEERYEDAAFIRDELKKYEDYDDID